MKRSEMLELMWREAVTTHTTNTTTMEMLDKALRVAEQHGMLPPAVIIKKYYGAFGIDNAGSYEGLFNAWESEE